MQPQQVQTQRAAYRKLFVFSLFTAVLAGFLFLAHHLLIAVLLSATFSGLFYALCNRLEKLLGGYRAIAAIIVILAALFLLGGPFFSLLLIAAGEALRISETVMPWVQSKMSTPMEEWRQQLQWLPFIEQLKPYESNIFQALSQLLQLIGTHLTKVFSAATLGTVDFFFKFFVAVYSAFFFLRDGSTMFRRAVKLVPLTEKEMRAVCDKGLRIIRATIRSLFVIGAIQGILVGCAFAVLGLEGAVFWGGIVMVLAAIPGLGAPLIWIPAVGYLVFNDRLGAGIALALWGMLVVGLVDNFLRPRIIGRDTQVPDLLILLSILGGLATFGVAGLILGPVMVSILMSAAEIYAKVFDRLLKDS